MVSGREPHGEKITVYLTDEELWALEEFRLNLRRDGVVADRGKVVRASIAAGLKNDKVIKRLLKEK